MQPIIYLSCKNEVKIPQIKILHTPGKNASVPGTRCRFFTKA